MEFSCPACGEVNLAGADRCSNCGWEIQAEDIPLPSDSPFAALLDVQVQQVMQPARALPAGATVRDAYAALHNGSRRSLALCDADARFVGVVQTTTLARQLAREGADAPLHHLALTDVSVLDPEEPLASAAQRMILDGVPDLFVVSENDEVLGQVAAEAILRLLVPLIPPNEPSPTASTQVEPARSRRGGE